MKIVIYLIFEKYHRYIFDVLLNQNHKCTWFEKKVLFWIHNQTIKTKFRKHLRDLTEEYKTKKPKNFKEVLIKKYAVKDSFLRYNN